MVVLPKDFVQLDRFPGYYWHVGEQKLYSLKVTGVLTPLKFYKATRMFARGTLIDYPDGYRISVEGKRRFVDLAYLMKISTPKHNQTFPAASS